MKISPPESAMLATPRLVVRAELIALGLLIACGLAAWGVGLRTAGYDYDEVIRAHSVWLAARGLRPYNDFFECHPPYFRLLVPVIAGQANPLPALRGLALVGNLLFLGGLGALGASLVPDARRWAWLGVAVVAWRPEVFAFLVEFRIDGWGYALAAWSLYRHHRRGSGIYRDFELGLLTGIATLFFCPKLTILPGLVVLIGQFLAGNTVRRGGLALGAYLAGVGGATLIFLGFLVQQQIEIGRMVQLLIRYHAINGSNSGFHFGLLDSIRANRLPLGLILAGVAAWTGHCLIRRVRPGNYEVALLLWLILQAAGVANPYKQYYAPWFLFASVLLGFIGLGLRGWGRWVGLILFVSACLGTGRGAIEVAWNWAKVDEAHDQERLTRWIDQVAGPDDRVVVSPPLHPINRRDTFFLWFNTADPSGFDSERILTRLPSYRDDVTGEHYRAELEAHPPALVLLGGSWRMVAYPAGQQRALAAFLPGRGYRTITRGPLQFAVRPDRLEPARQPD